MARIARVVVAGMPHHITQRGNRRQQVFFSDDNYAAYIDLMAEWCGRYGAEIWAYCLMPDHVYQIAMPSGSGNLRLAIGEAHRRYTRRICFREGWRGYLWQERFATFITDEAYLPSCARYIENNPVRSKLVWRPEQWSQSSAAGHIAGIDDKLTRVEPVLSLITGDWQKFLSGTILSEEVEDIRKHGRTGRPLGKDFS